jgi:hypothetical protein
MALESLPQIEPCADRKTDWFWAGFPDTRRSAHLAGRWRSAARLRGNAAPPVVVLSLSFRFACD